MLSRRAQWLGRLQSEERTDAKLRIGKLSGPIMPTQDALLEFSHLAIPPATHCLDTFARMTYD
jgi:hypothetical protein